MTKTYFKTSLDGGGVVPILKHGDKRDRFIEAAGRYCTEPKIKGNFDKMKQAFSAARKETLALTNGDEG